MAARLTTKYCSLALVAGGLVATASAALSQSYPQRPVRLVHGFIAGGNIDITARLLAQPMGEILGQNVIVDMRPGGGGTTAAGIIARSEADGYTLFLMASGHAAAPGLYRTLGYDPVNDFTMISMVAGFPFLLACSANFPAKGIGDFVRMAKAQPGKVDYATGGTGTGMHLAAVLFSARAGLKLNHVPYKGGNAAPIAVIAGEIPCMWNTPAGLEPFLAGGRIRVLAVTTEKRWGLWPDVPAIAEDVLPGFDVRGWAAVAAPKGLSPALTARLNQVVRQAIAKGDIHAKLAQMGTQVTPTSPQEAQKFLAAEVARWTRVVRDEGIAPQ